MAARPMVLAGVRCLPGPCDRCLMGGHHACRGKAQLNTMGYGPPVGWAGPDPDDWPACPCEHPWAVTTEEANLYPGLS